MDWDKQTIENSISTFVEENGFLPHPSDFAGNDKLPSRETFRRYLGMYPVEYYLIKYPELCDKGYTDRLPKNFNEEKARVLKLIDEFVEKNHRIPRKDEFTGKGGLPTEWQLKKYCGSITSLALERYPEYCQRKYSDNWIQRAENDKEYIVAQVKRFVEENDRMPTKKDLGVGGMPTYQQVRYRFANMKGMIDAAYPNNVEEDKKKTPLIPVRRKKKEKDMER